MHGSTTIAPHNVDALAERLAQLYETAFAGKPRGRYRLSMKHLRQLTGCRRVYPETVSAIARALYERGYVLIDMETYFVVLSQRTFSSYRRVNDAALGRLR
ncbi:MAG: hypothetical protein JSU82_12730 [Rhodospirillales bacterium]|nr:MAG: hypothetical protein JSU82_12730 [Rhodospirillales bacterium]